MLRRTTYQRLGLAAALALAALPHLCAAAAADELVVVEARGIALRPGEMVDAAKPLLLKEGQHVTFIAVNGATFKLDGPYDKPPTADLGGGGNTAEALRALVTQQQARIAEAGASRSGAVRVRLPEPWLMDVSRAALRMGAREVHLVCLESRAEMPAFEE